MKGVNLRFLICAIMVVSGGTSAISDTWPARGRSVAVLVALDSELNALGAEVELVGRALDFRGRPVLRARFQGSPLLLAQTGANPEEAAAIASWLVEERRVVALISVGPAGGLDSALEIGDVVAARTAIRKGRPTEEGFALRVPVDCDARNVDVIVTVDEFVACPDMRSHLVQAYGAEVVDMSAASIAAAAVRGRIPCVIIREITDMAGESAPREFSGVVRAKQPRTIPFALLALRDLMSEIAFEIEQ